MTDKEYIQVMQWILDGEELEFLLTHSQWIDSGINSAISMQDKINSIDRDVRYRVKQSQRYIPYDSNNAWKLIGKVVRRKSWDQDRSVMLLSFNYNRFQYYNDCVVHTEELFLHWEFVTESNNNNDKIIGVLK